MTDLAVPRKAATAATSKSSRETFLDVVRAIAILRVVLWHALGAAVLTYFVAAVPAMFFVTGSLLAKSLDHRLGRQVLRDRLRRLLMPLWVFGTAALIVQCIAHIVDGTTRTAVNWMNLIWWVLPLNDPHGSTWEGGYLSSPLWYLRALIWLIILSPLLLRTSRRFPLLCVVVPVAALAVLERLARTGQWTGATPWRLGDGFLYGTFLMLGFHHRDGRLRRVTTKGWLVISALSAFAAGAWVTTQPVPGWVVDDSHPAHLLVGGTWLALFLAARPLLERLGAHRRVAPLITGVSRRSLTIYLWHTTAIVIAYVTIDDLQLPTGVFSVLMLLGTAAATTVLVLLFGWVEDRANRRPARLWPAIPHRPSRARQRRLPRLAQAGAAVGVSLFTFAATTTVSSGVVRIRASRDSNSQVSSTLGLRVPSQQPKAPTFHADVQATAKRSSESTDDVEHDMQAAVDSWLKKNKVTGAEIAVYRPGSLDWAKGFGTDPGSKAAIRDDTSFDIASITKTFTATLVWQLVDRGEISLDDPLPQLVAVPDFPYDDQLTVRELLTHRSGLGNYRDTTEYRADPTAVITPQEAVAFTGHEPLAFAPDTKSVYSSVNYLVLGLLLEQVTGRPYDALLSDLLSASGIGDIGHTGPESGEPNFSAAGLTPTSTQLARWAVALLRDNTPRLSDQARDAMANIDPVSALGAGLWGYCPCTSSGGHSQFAAVGHSGAATELQYSTSPDVAIVVNLSDSIWLPDNRQDQLTELFTTLRKLAAEAP